MRAIIVLAAASVAIACSSNAKLTQVTAEKAIRAFVDSHSMSQVPGTAWFRLPCAFNASGILGHIFGQRQAPVQQGVAKASGIDLQSAGKVMMILAPIVMASLARARAAQGTNASAGAVLQNEQQHIERQVPGIGGLASILDRNHDGNIADDIANIAGGRLGGLSGGLGNVLGGILGDRR